VSASKSSLVISIGSSSPASRSATLRRLELLEELLELLLPPAPPTILRAAAAAVDPELAAAAGNALELLAKIDCAAAAFGDELVNLRFLVSVSPPPPPVSWP
jgi:hypothetical protein